MFPADLFYLNQPSFILEHARFDHMQTNGRKCFDSSELQPTIFLENSLMKKKNEKKF